MNAAKVCKLVTFSCGCMVTYHYKGDCTGRGWVVIPCKGHTEVREETAEEAALVWKIESEEEIR